MKAFSKSTEFSGRFTPAVRKLLSKKLDELKIPRYQVARFLGISWSTLRKWEFGPTTRCAHIYRKTITELINGNMDDTIIKSSYVFSAEKYEHGGKQGILSFLENFSGWCNLCSEYNKELDYIDRINAALTNTISSLLPGLLAASDSLHEIKDIINLINNSIS